MSLADYLQQTGTSQRHLAELVGVTQGRVSQWLGGETIPPERCIAIQTATGGALTCEQLRPDLEWHQLPDGRKVAVGPAVETAKAA
jgi:DNA-binding transcriptional regulator YdaS (Cro superfamily)